MIMHREQVIVYAFGIPYIFSKEEAKVTVMITIDLPASNDVIWPVTYWYKEAADVTMHKVSEKPKWWWWSQFTSIPFPICRAIPIVL